MSRSLINFLLLETIFDDISPVNNNIFNFSKKILSPSFTIVSDDCDTKVGRILSTGALALGKVSLFTYGTFDNPEITIEENDIISVEAVQALLASKIQRVATRSISTCTAEGGICRKCIFGTYRDEYPLFSMVPEVGSSFKVDLDTKTNYLTYLADTHVGGLMGMEPLQIERDAVLPVREQLLRSKVQTGEVVRIFREVASIPSIDEKLLEYARDMDDKLQKSLFLILLYNVFINVRI